MASYKTLFDLDILHNTDLVNSLSWTDFLHVQQSCTLNRLKRGAVKNYNIMITRSGFLIVRADVTGNL